MESDVATTGLVWVAAIQAVALGVAFVVYILKESSKVGALPRKLAEKRAAAEERRLQMEEERHQLTLSIQKENIERAKQQNELAEQQHNQLAKIEKLGGGLAAGPGRPNVSLPRMRNPEL